MPVKVTGDSLLIHEFTYSLFIGLCLVTSNMTGYSHSYHSIKLIDRSTPQRDVLSDKMVFWVVTQFLFHGLPVFFIKYCYKLSIQRQIVVTHNFYFMLCQSSLLSTTISFVYKDK